MEAQVLDSSSKEVNLSIKQADIGTLYIIQHELLKGSTIDFAGVIVKHPLTNEIWMRVNSAAVLALVAGIDPAVPVIFLDTAKHFPETLAYRDALVARLGLSDVRVVRPDPARVAAQDPDGDLWRRDPDRCCALRKALPLERALEGFDAWITGTTTTRL